jgi:solute carrier family 30 (zinc transporter), member 2
MFITAICGTAVNLMMMKILHQDVGGDGHGHSHGHSHGGHDHGHSGENINVKVKMPWSLWTVSMVMSLIVPVQAAFIHVVGDLVQSIGVVIASIIIWVDPRAHLADPICTFLFSILVLFTTVNILRQAGGTLLNAVPAHIDFDAVMADFRALPGVTDVHDLHIWTISSRTVSCPDCVLVVIGWCCRC